MLKVGDEVIIKIDLITDKSYDELIFVEEMEKYQGEKTKIKAVLKRGQYTLEIDDGEYYWNEQMFYPALVDNKLERKTFETGAIRDTDKTKGRCDLMPLFCVGNVLHTSPYSTVVQDDVLTRIEKIKEIAKHKKISSDEIYIAISKFILNENINNISRTGKKYYETEIEYRATIMLELSHHFKQGAEKYGVDNWKKGIPYSSYIDSGVRHYLKHLAGMTDERHDIAFLWNMICLAWTVENMPEMNDLKEKEKDDIR